MPPPSICLFGIKIILSLLLEKKLTTITTTTNRSGKSSENQVEVILSKETFIFTRESCMCKCVSLCVPGRGYDQISRNPYQWRRTGFKLA